MQIVWFKRDLRISDHAPLFEASYQGKLIPLYILEPELWKCPDLS
ncbi:MAG: deoxyribodipyrimidine photo-lyase, partial [Gammaproteobacteria bacterium]